MAGGGHPGAVDLGRCGERSAAPGDVLAQRPDAAGRVAGGADPRCDVRAVGPLVGEVAVEDHVARVCAGGRPQALVLTQRREPARGAVAVVQAQQRRADRGEVVGGGAQRRAGAGRGARPAVGRRADGGDQQRARRDRERQEEAACHPLWVGGGSNPPESSRRYLDTRTACHDSRRARDVAQPGSAPALGAGGRGFKSRRPDDRLAAGSEPPAAGRVADMRVFISTTAKNWLTEHPGENPAEAVQAVWEKDHQPERRPRGRHRPGRRRHERPVPDPLQRRARPLGARARLTAAPAPPAPRSGVGHAAAPDLVHGELVGLGKLDAGR